MNMRRGIGVAGLVMMLGLLVLEVFFLAAPAQGQRRTVAECNAIYRGRLEVIRRSSNYRRIEQLRVRLARARQALQKPINPGQRITIQAQIQRDQAELNRLSILVYNDIMKAREERARCLQNAIR